MTRNLSDIVDVVFVSDHGMTDTRHPELLYIDDILGEEGWQAVEHEDGWTLSLHVVSYLTQVRNLGWPSMGLHFNPSANTSHYLDVLLTAAADNSEKFNVYTPETMPEKYHFAHNTRIAPIYVVPNLGYVLTTRKEGDVGLSKGVCGPFMPWPCPDSLCDFSRTTGMTIMNLLCAPYLWHTALSPPMRRLSTTAGTCHSVRVGLWVPTKAGTQPRVRPM